MIAHLFVYGTLMPGRGRWPALAPWAIGRSAPDSVTGQLFDTGYGWPAAVIGQGNPIPGFKIALSPHALPEALDALDEIEGTHHGLFRRVSAMTESGARAWLYEWLGPTDGFVPIDYW